MAKSAKRKTDDAVTTAAEGSPKTLTDAKVTEHGHDLDDWLQAERELRRTRRSSAV
jgi:hypothetical protein